MNEIFNIYCDESRHTSDPGDNFMVIGAVEVLRERKSSIVRDIHRLRSKHDVQGEFGWKRLSPNKKEFYNELLSYFANSIDLSFRCIVVSKRDFRIDDEELGFYKLYYQMLHHWLEPSHKYYIYLDHKVNSQHTRLEDLKQCLRHRHPNSVIALEPVDSKKLEIMQLADLLIGAIGYTWNNRSGSDTKIAFCEKLASELGMSTLLTATWMSERKFNIFYFGGHNG